MLSIVLTFGVWGKRHDPDRGANGDEFGLGGRVWTNQLQAKPNHREQ
jgi:hypothetical protein